MAAYKTHVQRSSGTAYEWIRSDYAPGVPLGNVFYVHAGSGTDSAGYGFSPEAPFKTIAFALTKCTDSKGDTILVMPGHTEACIAAATIAVNKIGVTIQGLGTCPRDSCTISFTTAVGASFDITAAKVTLRNLFFKMDGINNLTAGHNITAADVTIDGCEYEISDGTLGAALCILTAATAARLKIINNRFLGPAVNAGQTCAAAIQHEAGVDYLIQNNIFSGKFTQAILNVATVLRGIIDNNRFVIGTGTVAITMAAASTPFITNNNMNVASGTAPIVAAAGFVSRNSYSAAAGVTAGTASTI